MKTLYETLKESSIWVKAVNLYADTYNNTMGYFSLSDVPAEKTPTSEIMADRLPGDLTAHAHIENLLKEHHQKTTLPHQTQNL